MRIFSTTGTEEERMNAMFQMVGTIYLKHFSAESFNKLMKANGLKVKEVKEKRKK